MGEGSINLERARFDIGDLGLLDGPAERGFEIITRNAGIVLEGSASLFCVLDDVHSSVFVRSRHVPRGSRLLPEKYDQDQSLFARFIAGNKSARITDLTEHPEFEDAFEPSVLPFKSVLAEPVYGPAHEPIGALIVLCHVPREWAELERMELKDQAHLLSRQVLLRASLETLKRLSRERKELTCVPRFRN